MSKQEKGQDEFYLALYMLNKRFHTPLDLVKYWAFSGPCIEDHPLIEDISHQS